MKKIFLTLALFSALFAHAQWEPDVRLTYDPSSSWTSWSTQHAMATCGDSIHVVWQDERTGHAEIYYKRSIDAGLSWGSDIQLTSQTDYSGGNATIVASGSVVQVAWMVFWEVGPPWYLELFYTRSEDGGNSWAEVTRLTYNFGMTWQPCMAVSDSVTHLVYEDYHVNWWEINYKRSTNLGLTWESDVRLTVDPGWSSSPSVCAAGPMVHVAWWDDRDTNQEIYYKRSADWGLTWGEDIRITYNDSVSKRSSIGTSGSNVYIVWQDNRDQNAEIYFMKSTDGGIMWGENIRLTNDTNQSLFPNLAVSDDHLFVYWEDTRDGNEEIYYKCSFDGGDNWGPDTRLTEDTAGSYRPFITVSGSQLNVIWYDDRDGNNEIYYKRDPGGNLPVGISDNPSNNDHDRISVYPNPASRQLTVGQLDSWTVGQLDDWTVGSQRSAVKLSIYDLYGREVKAFGNILSFPYQADISDLRDGVYFLKMNDDSGNAGVVKFVKTGE